jgi:hypothetical protein
MSRELGYYELKLMMLKETKQLKEASQADVEYALEDLLNTMTPRQVLDGLQNDIYADGTLRARLSLFRTDRENLRDGPLLWSWIEHRMRVAGEGETEAELSDLLKLDVGNQNKPPMGESVTKGLPKLRGRKYRKVSGSQLRVMIAEDCGSAHKPGQFDDIEEELPPVGLDPTIPKGVITKVQNVAPDLDGDGMGPDDRGRNLGNGGKSRMAREQLHHIAEYAVELWNLLDDEDEIPEWCQSKIAVMGDAMSKVKHHLEYKVEKPDALSLNGVSGE